MTKNERAYLEANYKMYVDKALAAKAKAQKNPDDKDLAARERAHWNIVYGYAMAAVTVLSLTVEEDEAYGNCICMAQGSHGRIRKGG